MCWLCAGVGTSGEKNCECWIMSVTYGHYPDKWRWMVNVEGWKRQKDKECWMLNVLLPRLRPPEFRWRLKVNVNVNFDWGLLETLVLMTAFFPPVRAPLFMRDFFFFFTPRATFFWQRAKLRSVLPARSSPLVGVGGDKTDPFLIFFPI